jgi:hypothetical protein
MIESIKNLPVHTIRYKWIRRNLRRKSHELRCQAKQARSSFKGEYMGPAAELLADVYDKAANIFDEAYGILEERE